MKCQEFKLEIVEPGKMEGLRYSPAKTKKVPTGREVTVHGFTSDHFNDSVEYCAAAIIEDEEGFLCACPLDLLKPL